MRHHSGPRTNPNAPDRQTAGNRANAAEWTTDPTPAPGWGTIRPACSVQAPAAEPGSFSIQRFARHARQLPSWLPRAQPAYRQSTPLTMMLDCIEVRWNHNTDSIALVRYLGPELGKSQGSVPCAFIWADAISTQDEASVSKQNVLLLQGPSD